MEEPYNGAAEEPLQNQVDAAGEASGNAENEVAQNSVISEVPPYIPDTMPMEEIGMDEATQNALDQMGLLTEKSVIFLQLLRMAVGRTLQKNALRESYIKNHS